MMNNPNMYRTGMGALMSANNNMGFSGGMGGMNNFSTNPMGGNLSSFNAPDPKIKESFAKDGFKVSGLQVVQKK